MHAKVCVLYSLACGFRRCFLFICAFTSFKSTSGECSRTGKRPWRTASEIVVFDGLMPSNTKSPVVSGRTRPIASPRRRRDGGGGRGTPPLPPSIQPILAANTKSNNIFVYPFINKYIKESTTMMSRPPCCRRLMADGIASTPPPPAVSDAPHDASRFSIVSTERNGLWGPSIDNYSPIGHENGRPLSKKVHPIDPYEPHPPPTLPRACIMVNC